MALAKRISSSESSSGSSSKVGTSGRRFSSKAPDCKQAKAVLGPETSRLMQNRQFHTRNSGWETLGDSKGAFLHEQIYRNSFYWRSSGQLWLLSGSGALNSHCYNLHFLLNTSEPLRTHNCPDDLQYNDFHKHLFRVETVEARLYYHLASMLLILKAEHKTVFCPSTITASIVFLLAYIVALCIAYLECFE